MMSHNKMVDLLARLSVVAESREREEAEVKTNTCQYREIQSASESIKKIIFKRVSYAGFPIWLSSELTTSAELKKLACDLATRSTSDYYHFDCDNFQVTLLRWALNKQANEIDAEHQFEAQMHPYQSSPCFPAYDAEELFLSESLALEPPVERSISASPVNGSSISDIADNTHSILSFIRSGNNSRASSPYAAVDEAARETELNLKFQIKNK